MTDPELTPPPELVQQWNQYAIGTQFEPYGCSEFIATRAAQWGYQQAVEELGAFLRKGHDKD